MPIGADISSGLDGEKAYSRQRVDAGKPIARAMLDLWSTDNEGFYDVQRRARACVHAEKSRLIHRAIFVGVKPVSYRFPRTVHRKNVTRWVVTRIDRRIRMIVSAPGYESVTTHIRRE
jgi:hydroxyquinol 1,2-dioxygenase